MSENQQAAEVNLTESKAYSQKPMAVYQRGRRAALKAGTWAPGRRGKGATTTADQSSPVAPPDAA